MCGIAGIVAPDVARIGNALDYMVGALRHRGPDGCGTHFFPNCGLGHARLAIIDLHTGQQPMLSPDGAVAVTFNGEIYGFQDLRSSLKGYSFRTSSDTEVILALYEKYGSDMLSRLPGMFAFAIWDDRRQELILGRDRFGEKPLYYALTPDGGLLFASELKAILAARLITPEVGSAGLIRYLGRGYPSADGSVYANISAVPPAHMLTFHAGKVNVRRYWQLPATRPVLSLSEAAETMRGLFARAVERQLVADVPVGAFLSGGLDSTTVVCAARRVKPDLKTFSFDFLGGHSEIRYARAVADELSTDHMELRAEDIPVADLFLQMQQVYDEPFYDSSNIATYLLCKLASEHTKVALTGDGADELVGGYSWYRYYPLEAQDSHFLFWRWTAARIAARIARFVNLDSYNRLEARNIRLKLQRTYPNVRDAHQFTMSLLREDDFRELGVARDLAMQGPVGTPGDNTVDAALRDDVTDYMPCDILVKTDRASMAHGLELRAPFLDVDLAEFCISLPATLKISGDTDKLVLRTAFANDWPAPVRNRKKQGFGAPVKEWLARPDMQELVGELLRNANSRIFEYCDFAGTTRFLDRSSEMQTWLLLNLAAWLQCRTASV